MTYLTWWNAGEKIAWILKYPLGHRRWWQRSGPFNINSNIFTKKIWNLLQFNSTHSICHNFWFFFSRWRYFKTQHLPKKFILLLLQPSSIRADPTIFLSFLTFLLSLRAIFNCPFSARPVPRNSSPPMKRYWVVNHRLFLSCLSSNSPPRLSFFRVNLASKKNNNLHKFVYNFNNLLLCDMEMT